MGKRNTTVVQRFHEKYVVNDSGCWDWIASRNREGYGKFKVTGKDIRAHRFSYELHRGGIPKGDHVLHTCDNPSCVNPAHLFLGRDKENIADKVAKGRQARGEKQHLAVLTAEDVREIRNLYATGDYSQRQIGEIYGAAQNTISHIVLRQTWMHVE